MAVKTGRGFAAIEYPTGMNQNGDPSQAWIKVKPDGRIDVFAGTSDIGNGSKTIQSQIVAETIGVPYEWITYDSEWSQHPDYQVQLFWQNIVDWFAPGAHCKVPTPPK